MELERALSQDSKSHVVINRSCFHPLVVNSKPLFLTGNGNAQFLTEELFMGTNGLKWGLRRGGGFPLGLCIIKKSLERRQVCNARRGEEHTCEITNRAHLFSSLQGRGCANQRAPFAAEKTIFPDLKRKEEEEERSSLTFGGITGTVLCSRFF